MTNGWGPPQVVDDLIRVELVESDLAVDVRMELPGVAPSDIQVSLAGDLLTVAVEQDRENEDAPQAFGGVRSFRRTVRLPAAVDVDAVEAETRHGVLSIHLPKSVELLPKRIEVRSST